MIGNLKFEPLAHFDYCVKNGVHCIEVGFKLTGTVRYPQRFGETASDEVNRARANVIADLKRLLEYQEYDETLFMK